MSNLLQRENRRIQAPQEGNEVMCEIVEKIIKEEMLDLARKAIIRGVYSPEEIAEIFQLPLSDIDALEREVSEEKTSGSPED